MQKEKKKKRQGYFWRLTLFSIINIPDAISNTVNNKYVYKHMYIFLEQDMLHRRSEKQGEKKKKYFSRFDFYLKLQLE